jgi:hypothetical protein
MSEKNKNLHKDGNLIKNIEQDISGAQSRAKLDKYIEMVLFLILGVLIGIALKTEANKRITIGYDDYRIPISKQSFSINKLQTELMDKYAKESQSLESETATPDSSGSSPAQNQSDKANQ